MQARLAASLIASGCCLAGIAACGGVLRTAGIAPMDSTRAVAVAERNVCGRVMGTGDSTCVLVGVNRMSGRYVVTLDRNPPAGNDRVNVTITGGNDVEVAQVPRPSGR